VFPARYKPDSYIFWIVRSQRAFDLTRRWRRHPVAGGVTGPLCHWEDVSKYGKRETAVQLAGDSNQAQ
jgi:hypothetical protein